ncbi:hypothetical protein [Agrococcus sp. DT81.2]|uniref:hypothetical protein n=1 Tax=Agrococcus sp. DT81.2 TaxID=3393414 RepID=UPI003CE4F9A1
MDRLDIGARHGLPGITYPDRFLHALTDELEADFAGIFAAETIERYVLESHTALLRTSAVKAHLVTRVTRFAKDRLHALAEAKGAIPQDRPSVLFVCVRNAGRSQMAAAIAAERSGGRLIVRSAGSVPAAFYPGKHYEDWQLDDPEHAAPSDVRRIRDEITVHVDRMLGQLGIAHS